MRKKYVLTDHALTQFKARAGWLKTDARLETLESLLHRAVPENVMTLSRAARFELFKRNVLQGGGKRLVADGWRFIVQNDTVVTVERVKPHENYPRECPVFATRDKTFCLN